MTAQLKEQLSSLSSSDHRHAMRELCRRDLFFLSEYVLRNTDSEKVPLNDEYHGEFCDFLMKGVAQETHNRKLLMAPRGTLKSTIANRNYAIWRIINNPNVTMLVVSATLDNSKKKLRAIQEVFERNEVFRYLFPELIPQSFNHGWTQTEMLVPRTSTDPEYTIEVQSVEGELTSRHYDEIIDDDVVGKENSATSELILKVIDYYTQSLQLIKKPHGRRLVIGTLWNFADLYNHILENLYEEYDILVRSIWKHDRYVRREDGTYHWITLSDKKESLYPEMLSLDGIEKLKKEVIADPLKGQSTWMAQYELKIIDEANAVFPHYVSQKENFYFALDELVGKKLAFSLSCDPAVSERKQADETAFTVRAVDELGVWYIIDVYGRIGMREHEIVDRYIHYLKTYPIDLCSLETISFQRNIQYALEERCQREGVFLPYFKLPAAYNNASKVDSDMKIRGLAPPYATGKMKFLQDDPETLKLLEQLWRFPKSRRDDRADSLAQHLHLPLIATRVWKSDDSAPEPTPVKLDRYGRPQQEAEGNKLYI